MESSRSPPYPIGERYFIRKQSNSQLSMMYDSRTRNPRWVIEVLSSSGNTSTAANRKKLKFYKDRLIDVEDFRVSQAFIPYSFRFCIMPLLSHQVSPTEYTKSGYSRGHLAPAADFPNSQVLDTCYSYPRDTFTSWISL